MAIGLGGASSAIGSGALPSTHTPDVKMTKRLSALAPRGTRALRRGEDRLDRELLDGRAAAGHRVERRVHVAVLRFGGAAKRLDVAEVADDRMRAARGDALGLLGVAHERRDGVTAAKQRVEHGRADVAGRTGQEKCAWSA